MLVRLKQLNSQKIQRQNFVFDDRLGETISEEVISHCHQCGKPSDAHVNCANKECNLLFIQCSECAEKHEGTCSPACQEIIHLPEEEQKKLRKGKKQQKIFHSHKKVNLKG